MNNERNQQKNETLDAIVSVVRFVEHAGKFIRDRSMFSMAEKAKPGEVYCVGPSNSPYDSAVDGKIVIPTSLSIDEFLDDISALSLIPFVTHEGLFGGYQAFRRFIRAGYFEIGNKIETDTSHYLTITGNIFDVNKKNYLYDVSKDTELYPFSVYGPQFAIEFPVNTSIEHCVDTIRRLKGKFQYASHEDWQEMGVLYNPLKMLEEQR